MGYDTVGKQFSTSKLEITVIILITVILVQKERTKPRSALSFRNGLINAAYDSPTVLSNTDLYFLALAASVEVGYLSIIELYVSMAS
jgi:hypothetical protein